MADDRYEDDPEPVDPEPEPGDLVIELDENSVPHVYTQPGKREKS